MLVDLQGFQRVNLVVHSGGSSLHIGLSAEAPLVIFDPVKGMQQCQRPMLIFVVV